MKSDLATNFRYKTELALSIMRKIRYRRYESKPTRKRCYIISMNDSQIPFATAFLGVICVKRRVAGLMFQAAVIISIQR